MSTRIRTISHRIGRGDQRGASFVIFAIALLALLGFAALAIDVSNLVVARQELRNAADAGALAGARCLYNDGKDYPEEPDCLDAGGTVGDVNINANLVARDAAIANLSRKTAVEVYNAATNLHDVERGHWSFGLGGLDRGFYPNSSTAAFDLWAYTTVELDEDVNFINAVRVTTRRQQTEVQAFFARVLGFMGFEAQARAVAWIGFAGSLEPAEVDQPIAICKQKLLAGEHLDCNVGRFVPSTEETGGWTTFEQVESVNECNELNTPDSTVRALVCSGGNPNPLTFGDPMAANNGQLNNSFRDLAECWEGATEKIEGWSLTLPVVDCETQTNG
jgi:hypothetical protein